MAYPRKPRPMAQVAELAQRFETTGWFVNPDNYNLAERLRNKAQKWDYFRVIYKHLEHFGTLGWNLMDDDNRDKPANGRPKISYAFSVTEGTNDKVKGIYGPAAPGTPEVSGLLLSDATSPVAVPATKARKAVTVKLPATKTVPAHEVTVSSTGTATVTFEPVEASVPVPPATPSLAEIRARLDTLKAAPVEVPAPAPVAPPVPPADPLALLRDSILSTRYGVSA